MRQLDAKIPTQLFVRQTRISGPARERRIFARRDRYNADREIKLLQPCDLFRKPVPGRAPRGGDVIDAADVPERRRGSALAWASASAEVGAPTWSDTTRSSCPSRSRRRIVSRKFLPRAAYTQLVRTIRWGPSTLRIARSPASLLRP